MQSLLDDWNNGNRRKLAILGGAAVATFVAILMLARLATAPTMELLFARLDPAVAGRIVGELQARDVAHDVRGDSIYVDGARRDALRLELAGEGLPGADGTGYELLDNLSGFGTTSQMFDAAYWRAREGELARTILAGRGVDGARVHIATPGRSPFSRERGATASVTLRMKSGDVPPELAEAVQSLVSGAVRGLEPGGVSVVDAASGRVVSRDPSARDGAVRSERLAEMRAAVDRLLTARVGPGRFVAEINLETRTDVEQLRERTLDPASRVVISTDTEELSSSETGGAAEGVTIASNLPEGDAGGGGDSASQSAETRERVNYEVSERERQVTRGVGAVERLSVAVMLDGVRDEAGAFQPRSEEEIDAVRELVASAVGFQADRGDVVTVRSVPFEAPPIPADGAAGGSFLSGAQVVRLATVGALLLAAVAVPALVARPLLAARGGAGGSDDRRPEGLPAPDAAMLPDAAGGAAAAALGGAGPGGLAALPGPAALPAIGELPALPDLTDDAAAGEGAEDDPVERLRRLISDRRDETVEVLRGWIEEDATEGEKT